MQESSDGGSAGLLWNTSHNPLSVGVRDHVTHIQCDHHEEEGRTEVLLITGTPSVSHPQNVAESRHSSTLVLEQGYLPDSLTSTGSPQTFKDPELDTATWSTDLAAPTCDPSTPESSDRGSARNTSHNPLSVGVRDHVTHTQCDHHEEEGRTEILPITGSPLVSHPQNVAESGHSNALVLKQGHLPDSLTSTGLTGMFKDPELDTATSNTSSDLVAPNLPTFGPILDKHKLHLLESEHHQEKSESCLLEAELHVTQLAESSHRRTIVNLKNEVAEKDHEITQLRQRLADTLREKEAESEKREEELQQKVEQIAERDDELRQKDEQIAQRDQTIQELQEKTCEELRQKDEQIALRDQTIQKLHEEKCEVLPEIYEKIAQMDRSIQELKEVNNCKGKKRGSTDTISKGYVLRSHDCGGKQVIEVTEDNG